MNRGWLTINACRWLWLIGLLLGVRAGFGNEERAVSLRGGTVVLQDVSEQTEVRFQSLRLNRALNVWNVEATVRNTGTNAIKGPLVLSIEGISGTSGPLQPDGQDSLAHPCYDLSTNLAGLELAPGAATSPRTLSLALGAGTPSLTNKVFAAVPATNLAALAVASSLNAFGQPLTDVVVEETGPAGQRLMTTDNRFGLVTLGVTNGLHQWRFSKVGYLPAWREFPLTPAEVALLPSPRLTQRSAQPITLTPLSGGAFTNADGTIRLAIEPGQFAQETTATLTALNGQNLPGFLPLGWSPLAAFWLELATEPVRPINATLVPWGPISPGESAILARWNAGSLRWDVLGAASGNGTNGVSLPLPGSGAFVLVVADTGEYAPPAAQIGQSLAGVTSQVTNYSRIYAGGQVVPSTIPASKVPELVTATGQATFTNQDGALPSGLLLRCEITERYLLQDQTRRNPPRYTANVVAYQRPGDQSAATVGAAFPLRPLMLYGADELLEGRVTIDIFEPGQFTGGILETNGGVVASDGVAILASVGDLAGRQAVQIRRLEVTNFLDLAVAGSNTVVVAFELGVGEVVSGRRLRAQLGTQTTNSYFVLARVLSYGGVTGLEPVERFISDTAGALSSAEPATGERLPGITGAGQYLLLNVGGPQALILGVARSTAGQAAENLVVRTPGQPWMTLSAADGTYRLIGPAGNVAVSALDLATGDFVESQVTVVAPQTPVTLDLATAASGPRVVEITPASGAKSIPRVTAVVIRFSEPINPGTLAANGIELLGTNGQPVAASLSLNLRNTIATFLPTAPLTASALHTVRISTNVADLTGAPLEGTNTFTFTTASDELNRAPAQLYIYEPTNGLAAVFGTPGTADAEVPVILVNETSGRTATILSKPDGSFTNFIEADVDDFLSAVLVNQNGTRTTVPASRQIFRDGSVGLYNGGGILEAEGDGGPVQVIVEPGAIETKTQFRLQTLSASDIATLLDGVQPSDGAKPLGGFSFQASGDELKNGADVRIPVSLNQLELPPGGDPSNTVCALTVFHEIDGVKVFEVVDKLEYRNGYLESHSPPFPGLMGNTGPIAAGQTSRRQSGGLQKTWLGNIGGAFEYGKNLIAIKLGYGAPVVLEGWVVSKTASNTAVRPVRGALVFVDPGDVAGNDDGRVSTGTVLATADASGLFALLVNVKEENTGFQLLASSLLYPNRYGYGKALPLEDNPLAAKGNVVFVRGGPVTAAPDNLPPIVTISHEPFEPATNDVVKFQIFATDNANQPTINMSIASVTSLSLSNNVQTSDFTLTRSSQTSQGFSTRAVYTLRSRKEGYLMFNVSSADNNGNITTVIYDLTVGINTNTQPVTTVLDPNDHLGPFVVSTVPRHGIRDFSPLDSLSIHFSEPISDSILSNVTTGFILTPDAGEPFASLSADGQTLTLRYPRLQADTSYGLTINSTLRDLNGNRFDQIPQNNPPGVINPIFSLDRFTLSFQTRPYYFAKLPGMANGGGIVHSGTNFFALERRGATGAAALKVYAKDSADLPVLAGYLRLPEYPRDLVFIKNYHFKDAQNRLRSADIIMVVGGLVGSETGQWIWAIDVSNPTAPEAIAQSYITKEPEAAVVKLAWSPPMVGYLEYGAEFHSIGLIDLQLFLYAQGLANLDNEPQDGAAGLDKNGDGDYVDNGEEIPRPAKRRLMAGILNGGLVNAHTLGELESAPITDFGLGFGGRFVAVAHGKVPRDGTGAYRTLAVNGVPLGDTQGRFTFPRQPDRLLLVFGAQLKGPPGPTSANLALVCGGKPGKVSVLDITIPETPTLLSDIPMPAQSGDPKEAVIGEDGNILVATPNDVVMLDTSLLGRPTNAAGHPAIMGTIKGMGSGSRTFVGEAADSLAVNLGARARVSTTNANAVQFKVIDIVGIDRNLVVSNAWTGLNLGTLQAGGTIPRMPSWSLVVTPSGVKISNTNFNASLSVEKGSPPPTTERRSRNGLLQVVAGSKEKYAYEATIDPDGLSPPTNWPHWKQDGTNPLTGVTVEFDIEGYYTNLSDYLSIVPDAFLAFSISPKTNLVTCESQQLVMETYPPVKASMSFDLAPIKKMFEETVEALNFVLGLAFPGPRFTVKVEGPEGKIGYSHEWRECPDSHQAFYTFELKPEIDPIAKITGGWEFRPQPPAFISQLIPLSFKVFVGLVASGSINATLSRSECGNFSGAITPSAKLTALLSVVATATNSYATVLDVSADCNSSITVTGQIIADGTGVKLNAFKADSDGLNAQLKIKFMDGFIEYSGQWNLLPPQNLINGYNASIFEFSP